jgi:hypothetical protein
MLKEGREENGRTKKKDKDKETNSQNFGRETSLSFMTSL